MVHTSAVVSCRLYTLKSSIAPVNGTVVLSIPPRQYPEPGRLLANVTYIDEEPLAIKEVAEGKEYVIKLFT